jgi:hypothetical protein
MAHEVCHDVKRWVDEVGENVEKCVERDCNWWCLCCNKWLCWIAWVVITAAGWVVDTVCELVADVADILVAAVKAVVNIVVGLFTLDFARIWDAVLDFAASVGALVWDIVRLLTLGSLIGAFRDAANRWSLRSYVTGLIDNNPAYSAEDRRRIKDALGITGDGPFGLRLTYTAFRGFVRSDQRSHRAVVPDLVRWHNDRDADTRVDLKILAGFESTSFWQRGRPEIEGDFSASDVERYLADPTSVEPFTIFAMSDGVLDDKLSAAVVKGTQLGLVLRFDKRDVQLTHAEHVRMGLSPDAMRALLESTPFNRTAGTTDPTAAKRDLCTPITIGSFLYADNSFTGLSAHLATHPCLDGNPFPGDDITGSTFRDRLPDFVFRYVPIHEIGHTFGLCHVDGLDRIMVSAKQNSLISWATIPEYWLSGSPTFTHDEAKRVWDYIVAHFSVECLATRQFA